MSSYSYRGEHWDDRPVTIKRYVIPSEEREERREFESNREMVIHRRESDEPITIRRYERDIEYDIPRRYDYDREYSFHSLDLERPQAQPAAVMREQSITLDKVRTSFSPRDSEYDMIRRSEVDEDPYYYHRRHTQYDERRSRRDFSPGETISTRRRDHDRDYSSDDSMVYVRKETRKIKEDHHKRHLAEGALLGAGAAELVRHHRKREGEEVSHGVSHAVRTAGAGALGAVAINAAGQLRKYYRSKSRSRHRSHSFGDDYHRSYHTSRGRSYHTSRGRSRSHSRPHAKTLLELGLGAAAVAAGVAALRKSNKNNNDERRSRSRTRSWSRNSGGVSTTRTEETTETGRSESQRRKHIAGAGLAGAAVVGLIEHARNRSRSRHGRSRSKSRVRKALPVIAAGLGTAAATGLYEKKKAEKEVRIDRRQSRSRSRRGSPERYTETSRESTNLIEYGRDPVTGSIPAEHYYGAPASPDGAYYSDGFDRRESRRSRSRSRVRYSSSSGEERRSRSMHRSRSRSRAPSEASFGAGLGHTRRYSRDRGLAERDHFRKLLFLDSEGFKLIDQTDDGHRSDPYEESYNPAPFSNPSPNTYQPYRPASTHNYYPNSNYFPPPPPSTGSTPNLHYNPADYPPPPGAGPPPQPYSSGAQGYAEAYARPRGVYENVSARQRFYSTDQHHLHGVKFDFSRNSSASLQDPGYETDDSDTTIHPHEHRTRPHPPRHQRRHHRSSSVPYSATPNHPSTHRSSSSHSQHQHRSKITENEPESDSTVEILPDRFDKNGHLIEEREHSTPGKIEDFVNSLSSALFS
ncbi:hypothetical protein N7495_008789 [Penicillium taxi]|uniref:uncharacterized protein n=1 Tax=Penicillium taxi TaxID=168475 RepID=UPI002545BA08|nr:uncharacterized protein N7495_008789 [Penicillium taxi]KAJ5888748.1 hypothetical protein N7495_008789 [Penicillium taxi]